jgi:hypothetical protein
VEQIVGLDALGGGDLGGVAGLRILDVHLQPVAPHAGAVRLEGEAAGVERRGRGTAGQAQDDGGAPSVEEEVAYGVAEAAHPP